MSSMTTILDPSRVTSERSKEVNEKLLARADKKIPLIECFGPTISGEGAQIGQQTYFLRFGLCLEASQRVLMADWSLKPISLIEEGDVVLAADLGERGKLYEVGQDRSKKVTALVPSKVLRTVCLGVKPVIDIITDKGKLTCTEDHEVFSYTNNSTNGYWKRARNLAGKDVRQIRLQGWTKDYQFGWLHGALAGDGSIHKFQGNYWRMKLSCGDVEIRDKAFEILEAIGAPNPHKIMHDSGNGNVLLPGVEVTNHAWVEAFRAVWLLGQESLSYRRGWLAGFFDTDGSWVCGGIKEQENSGAIWYWQNTSANEWKSNRCIEYLGSCGFTCGIYDRKAVVGMNSVGNVGISVNKSAEFFSACPGVVPRKRPTKLNLQWIPRTKVNVVQDNRQLAEVWDITTEHGSFIAEGMIVHNCDYKCTMCDSMHAVDPALVKKGAKWLSQKDIAKKFLAFREEQGGKTPWVTFSGGNPCIHDLNQLVHELTFSGQDIRIAVETQGTHVPEWLQRVSSVTVSPKSPGMGEIFEEEKFVHFMKTMNWMLPTDRVSVKIVIFTPEDITFAAKVHWLMRDKLFFQQFYLSQGNPVHADAETSVQALTSYLRTQYIGLAELLYRHETLSRVKFLPQMHCWLFGNKQGV